MAGFDGAGTYVRNYNWTQDAANAIPILASRFDTEDNGFATGLSNVICRDGQSTVSANIPFNSKRITGLGDATAGTDALNRQSADARYLQSTIKRKAAATLRHSTTTLTADPDLTFTLIAGTYSIEAFLAIGNVVLSDTNGFKYSFTYSGSASSTSYSSRIGFINGVSAVANSAIVYNGTNAFAQVSVITASTWDWLHIIGQITTTTGGTFALTWAQQSSTTTDVAIEAGSWMRVGVIS